MDEDAEEIATPTRTFSWRDVTSGIPDDCREEDEREEGRQLRDLRGRVKAARAVVANTPGLAETLGADWPRATRFYVKYGITETLFRRGGPAGQAETDEDRFDQIRIRLHRVAEV